MSSSSSKNTSTRYGLVVFLILGLFFSAIFLYIRNYKTADLARDFNHISALRENYEQIDSCIILLYNADNNAKLFAATADKTYIRQFARDISLVSAKLDTMKQTAEDDAKKSPEDLKKLIEQKEIRTQLYFKLRQLTDSLINVSSGIDTAKSRINTVNEKAVLQREHKTVIAVDTIKSVVKPQKSKNLFGRLADAIANKKDNTKSGRDTSNKVVRTETKLDDALHSDQTRTSKISGPSGYLNSLSSVNSLLKKNEIAILQLNKRIIGEIVSLLQAYKEGEKKFIALNKQSLNQNISYTFKSMDNIFLGSIILLVIMVLAILYNLFRIYKNESDLISSSHKASEFALAKSKFLANMSHEIRTPLNSVIGFSEQLSQGQLDEQQAAHVSAIRSSSVILLDVVNDILDFSKYESYKVNFDKMPFRPYEVLNEILHSIRILAEQKGITLSGDLSFEKNICFSGDSLRLKQVIMNLLSNAIKFTEKGGVTLKADVILNAKKQGLLKVQVIDTGIGLVAKDLEMIFDEFAQVDYLTVQTNQKGTGLGLAICKKIVEFQGGKISVSSEPGKGSVFSFEIPYELCDEAALAGKSIIAVDTNHLIGKRILLVDDNKMNVLLAQTVIKKYKMITDVAYDGKAAFELFEQNRYDLILTDIQMPEMNGMELTQKIRSYPDPSKKNISILGFTANVLQEDRKMYLESGMNDLVLKPFSEKELIDKMAAYLVEA